MSVTLKDIAQHVGLSVTTVSRALGGFDDVALETRQIIQTAADELGYVPNVMARRLKKQKTETIGFIIPTAGPRFSDPFFSDFLAGVGNEAAEHDYDLLISTHAPHSERERKAYQKAAQGGWVDGLIVVRTREQDERIAFLQEHQFPFVAYGRTRTEHDYLYVDEDSVAGMRQVVQHLIDLGHRRIGLIAPPSDLLFAHYRREAYLQTMRDNGLPTAVSWLIEGDLTQRDGRRAAAELIIANPDLTAVIGGNDLMAIGAMQELRQRGYTIGRDISVAGFDDIPLAGHTTPTLTTVSQPIYAIGRRTCAMLIKQLNGEELPQKHILLMPTLVIRDSTGPAPR